MGGDQARVILIAGPSSSGKTSFSRRLAVHLLAVGLSPFAHELDNYFVDREKTPVDENGQYDFETLETIDLDLLVPEHLQRLVAVHELEAKLFGPAPATAWRGEPLAHALDRQLRAERRPRSARRIAALPPLN